MGQNVKRRRCWLLYWKKVMTAGIALGWRKMDLVELKQRYVSVINRVDLWNPIDNSIFIDQNPIDSYTSRKLCTSSWHVYLNSPLCLHNQKPCCGMIKHDSVPCNLIFPKIIRIAWGWSSQTMLPLGWRKSKFLRCLPTILENFLPPKSSTETEKKMIWKSCWINRILRISRGWFSGEAAVTLHLVPDSHPLDDEANLYEWGMLGNHHFHPFKEIVVYLQDHPI